MYQNFLEQARQTADKIRSGQYEGKRDIKSKSKGLLDRPKKQDQGKEGDQEQTFEELMLETMMFLRSYEEDLDGTPQTQENKPVRPQSYEDVVYSQTVLEDNDVDYATTAKGLAEAAEALGMDPVDLATIVSYETAGTFNPTKAGPTTKWGQHKGFIQFGEPQAQQYGVNWEDPYGSQLGADGAIVRYFQDNGFQPGMGLLDAYSIVNAGAPGLYDRSDEAAGGAPGTVRDKVFKQMAGHKAKARNLMEQYYG